MKQLTRLFIPICLETLFYMLSGMVDTLMLSAVGDYAVGAVGTANSYIGIFIIMFLRACLWLHFYFREQERSFVW